MYCTFYDTFNQHNSFKFAFTYSNLFNILIGPVFKDNIYEFGTSCLNMEKVTKAILPQKIVFTDRGQCSSFFSS